MTPGPMPSRPLLIGLTARLMHQPPASADRLDQLRAGWDVALDFAERITVLVLR